MSGISVVHLGGQEYQVTVTEGRSSTTHHVIVWPSDVDQFAPGASPEELIEASFRFLLDREPKEAILKRFELAAIERYFPEYRGIIGGMVDGPS